ncbi:hypothetical protein FG877_13600 [Enterococcus casseliflavus]|nr:hypothetical protein [Enterococcus casseliflavus]
MLNELLYYINSDIAEELPKGLLDKAIKELYAVEDRQTFSYYLTTFLTGLFKKNTHFINDFTELVNAIFSMEDYTFENKKRLKKDFGIPTIEYAGSGKKGLKTPNISTGSSIVAASCGAKIIKNGSFATSSVTGSADFWNILGVDTLKRYTEEQHTYLLDSTGFTFQNVELSLPKFNDMYNGVYFAPHFLSFGLPALLGDIKGDKLIYGCSFGNIDFSNKVLKNYYSSRTILSSTDDYVHYIDELSGLKNNIILDDCDLSLEINEYLSSLSELQTFNKYVTKNNSKDKKEAVNQVVDVLKGGHITPLGNMISINSGLLLYYSGIVSSFSEGYEKSKYAIKNGLSYDHLNKIIIGFKEVKDD